MEKLNEKYGLDYFSDSELDSDSDEGKNYRYEHKYETLIQVLRYFMYRHLNAHSIYLINIFKSDQNVAL